MDGQRRSREEKRRWRGGAGRRTAPARRAQRPLTMPVGARGHLWAQRVARGIRMPQGRRRRVLMLRRRAERERRRVLVLRRRVEPETRRAVPVMMCRRNRSRRLQRRSGERCRCVHVVVVGGRVRGERTSVRRERKCAEREEKSLCLTDWSARVSSGGRESRRANGGSILINA